MGIIFSLIPPIPIRRSNYICDKRFALDDIKALYEDRPYYALIIMNARETWFWLANDFEIRQVKKIEMNVANSHQKGGSSAGRFDRIFENKRDRNNTYQVETILKLYYDFSINRPKVVGFIIGGAAETRSRVFGDAKLNILKDYIIVNKPYLGLDPFVLYQDTQHAREDYEQNGIKKKVGEIEEMLEKCPDLLSFGIKETHHMLNQHILRKCYVDCSNLEELTRILSSYKDKVEVIEIADDSLQKWGGCVGILVKSGTSYNDDNDDDDDDDDYNNDNDNDNDNDNEYKDKMTNRLDRRGDQTPA
jgi:peptide subunit release factor 1 (eRF1)